MRKAIVWALALLALCTAAEASGTKRANVLSSMWTKNDFFGPPPSAGDPFTCDANTVRSVYYDTLTSSPKICNGSAWSSLGGISSPVSGDFVWTGENTYGSAAGAAFSITIGGSAECAGGGIVFEGATADDFETTLCADDPTADKAISLPILTAPIGYVLVASDTQGASGRVPYWTADGYQSTHVGFNFTDSNATLTLGEVDDANSMVFGNNSIVAEGATANGFETTINFTDPTADATFRFPALAAGTYTPATLEGDNTWSGTNIINNSGTLVFGTANDFTAHKIGFRTTQTPDSTMLFTGSLSNAWHVAEHADVTYDFTNGPCGSSACTNPTLVVHSANQATTQWISATHNATNGVIDVGTGSIVLDAATTVNGTTTASGGYFQAASGYGFAYAPNNAGYFGWSTVMTPDAGQIALENTALSLHLIETQDNGYDFQNGPCGTSACAHPTLVLHPDAQNTTNYRGHAYYGSAGKAVKTLTDAVATAVVRIPVASGAGTGGTLTFTVFATNATDHQTLTGMLYFNAVNKAGTETCTDPTIVGTALNSNSTGTLTCTYACDETPANAVDITFNCDTSLTSTTFEAYTNVELVGPGVPAPQ
jgi:hypothetical protein